MERDFAKFHHGVVPIWTSLADVLGAGGSRRNPDYAGYVLRPLQTPLSGTGTVAMHLHAKTVAEANGPAESDVRETREPTDQSALVLLA